MNESVLNCAPQASPSPSPVGYSPMTPGAPSPGGYNPHTPGSNIDQASNDWVTTDIMVRVKDTFLDGGVINQTGIIRSVTVSEVFMICFQKDSTSRSMWVLDLHILCYVEMPGADFGNRLGVSML